MKMGVASAELKKSRATTKDTKPRRSNRPFKLRRRKERGQRHEV